MASKREESARSVGIGIGVAIAVAIGCIDLQRPIAIAIATPIPIPMIATWSGHDRRPAPHFWIKCPPIYELISKSCGETRSPALVKPTTKTPKLEGNLKKLHFYDSQSHASALMVSFQLS